MAHIPLRHGLHNQIHKNKTPPYLSIVERLGGTNDANVGVLFP
jgi:hypothetical protein